MLTGASKRVVWIYPDDHYPKQPFIELGAEWLRRAGHHVGIVDAQSRPISGGLKEAGLKGDQASAGSRAALPLPVMRVLWGLSRFFSFRWGRWAPGARWARKAFHYLWMAGLAASERPDVIVTTGLKGAAIGWLANLFSRSRMVYYPLELYGEQHSHERWWWRHIERVFLRVGIDALVTQNAERGWVYVNERGASVEPTIVHNYKPHRSVIPKGLLRNRLKLPGECRIVLYQGMLGHGRWLENLALSAAYFAPDACLVFMGAPTAWWLNTVNPMITAPGLAGRVLLAPWVPHAELLPYVADADVGVIIYDNAVRNNYFCEPGKLSDYVLAGVPVIAPPFPTVEPVVRRYGIGLVFGDPSPQEIARAVNKVLAVPKSSWQERIQEARRDLIWETQYPAFERAVLGRD
jgi:glycosyltransferase involved in cell wall biosynthesis